MGWREDIRFVWQGLLTFCDSKEEEKLCFGHIFCCCCSDIPYTVWREMVLSYSTPTLQCIVTVIELHSVGPYPIFVIFCTSTRFWGLEIVRQKMRKFARKTCPATKQRKFIFWYTPSHCYISWYTSMWKQRNAHFVWCLSQIRPEILLTELCLWKSLSLILDLENFIYQLRIFQTKIWL